MFYNNNSCYFDYNLYIEFSTDTNKIVRWKIGDPYIRGYRILSFRFIRPERFVMSHTTRHWFIYDFLPRCHMDDFTFEVCLSTFPTKLRNSIKQYLKHKEEPQCIIGQTNN